MRLATDLHGGLVQRQPPPRRFRIPFDDTPRIFAAHAGTRTNHGTLQPCAGTSVASVSSFIAGASQIIIIRPAAFVQRTGKTTSAGLRSVRLRGKRSRLWCRRLGSNQRREPDICLAPLYPTELRLHEGGVPRHIPLWRRGGSLVLLWRWVTPFSRQPRRFSRCPKWAGLGGGPLCHVMILAREPQRAAWRYRWGSDPRPAHYE